MNKYDRKPRADKPETLSQARTWDKVKVHYIGLGLCGGCAAQAAWGLQIGFSRVLAPCETCQPVIAGFPNRVAGAWRSWPYRQRLREICGVVGRGPTERPVRDETTISIAHPASSGAIGAEAVA